MVSPARARVGSVRNASWAGGPAKLVAVKFTAGNAPAVTVTVFVPTRVPSVHPPALASPAGSLVSLVAPRAPPPVAAKSTMTPATPLPNWSATFTTGAVTAAAPPPAFGAVGGVASCRAPPAAAGAGKVAPEAGRAPTGAVPA